MPRRVFVCVSTMCVCVCGCCKETNCCSVMTVGCQGRGGIVYETVRQLRHVHPALRMSQLIKPHSIPLNCGTSPMKLCSAFTWHSDGTLNIPNDFHHNVLKALNLPYALNLFCFVLLKQDDLIHIDSPDFKKMKRCFDLFVNK